MDLNDISSRDMELAIFGRLSCGCTTYPALKSSLINRFEDHTKKEGPDETDHGKLSDKSLYKFLSLLRKNNLIQSARYFDRTKRKNFTLYANTEDSIDILIKESGYPYDHIRSPYLPGRFAFWHDMALTEVVRTIKRYGQIYSYQYGFIDEFALRRATTEKSKKGDQFPDLKLRIKTREGNVYFFRIEVQRSRDRVMDFAKKLSKSKNNLVLYSDRRLIRDLADTHIFIRDNAIFVSIDDFISNGIFEAKWLSCTGHVVGLVYSNG
jgi:hypothetical protein